MCCISKLVTVNAEIFVGGLIFVGKHPHENLTHENLYAQRISNSNYGRLLLPAKINPLENLTHENLYVYGICS